MATPSAIYNIEYRGGGTLVFELQSHSRSWPEALLQTASRVAYTAFDLTNFFWKLGCLVTAWVTTTSGSIKMTRVVANLTGRDALPTQPHTVLREHMLDDAARMAAVSPRRFIHSKFYEHLTPKPEWSTLQRTAAAVARAYLWTSTLCSTAQPDMNMALEIVDEMDLTDREATQEVFSAIVTALIEQNPNNITPVHDFIRGFAGQLMRNRPTEKQFHESASLCRLALDKHPDLLAVFQKELERLQTLQRKLQK